MAILAIATSVSVVGVPTHRSGALPVTAGVAFSPASLGFGRQRIGTHGRLRVTTFTNTGTTPVVLQSFALTGSDLTQFVGFTDCFPNGAPTTLPAGGHCRVGLYFQPTRAGAAGARLDALDDAPGSPQSIPLSGTGTEGYFIASANGGVGNFGDAVFRGDATSLPLAAPMISLATTPDGAGYWLLARDGGIFSYGNAVFHGSTGAIKLNQPIVALSPSPSGDGYWLVASDGGIFTFGDAVFSGSTGSMRLNQPVDGMAATSTGNGYWLVASDGGVFTFGDAIFYGSTGNLHLSAPVVQITPTRSGLGYWLVTADGHLYAFGDAHYYGSAVGQSIVGMALTADGRGYWEASANGAVFAFGDAPGLGDLGALGVNDVVGIAATAPPVFTIGAARAAASPAASAPTPVFRPFPKG